MSGSPGRTACGDRGVHGDNCRRAMALFMSSYHDETKKGPSLQSPGEEALFAVYGQELDDILHRCGRCGLWDLCRQMGRWAETICQAPPADSCTFVANPCPSLCLVFVLMFPRGWTTNHSLFSEKDPHFAARHSTPLTRLLPLPPSFKSSTSPSCLFSVPTHASAKSRPIRLSHSLTRRPSMTPPRPRCFLLATMAEHSG